MRHPRACLAAVALAALFSTGCYHEGGSGFLLDQHTYISTEWRPWTITLVNSATGQQVWSVEVEVGKQLVVNFREGEGPGGDLPDIMAWEVMEAGKWFGELDNAIAVPSRHTRRLDTRLRPVPELRETRPPVVVSDSGQ